MSRRPSRADRPKRFVSRSRSCPPVMRSDARTRRLAPNWSVTAPCALALCESSTPTPRWRIRPERSEKSGCTGRTSPWATGGTPSRLSARSVQSCVSPSPGTPDGPWLRTGDLGVISDGELFIIGRIKDLLIVDGRNHYPDDIEATIQEITGGRVAAISIPDNRTERLVTIIELKKRGGSDEEAMHRLRTVKREVTSAISQVTQFARGGCGAGAARLDSDHDKRQGSAFGLCRALPAETTSRAWTCRHDVEHP